LLPIYKNAKNTAYTATCQSNLRQMGLAFRQYTTDHNRRFPGGGNMQNWADPCSVPPPPGDPLESQCGSGHWVAGPCNGNNSGMCQNDTSKYAVLYEIGDPEKPTDAVTYPERGGLYKYVKEAKMYYCPANAFGAERRLSYSMNCALGGSAGGISESLIREPSKIILLVDEEYANDGYFWANAGGSTDTLTKQHNEGGNLLFVDGHVSRVTFDTFPLGVNSSSPASATNKSKTDGDIRFHDRAFGPKGSYYRTGDALDACNATVP
jgi:prepilin-type processing-associated H-X9-DG protein